MKKGQVKGDILTYAGTIASEQAAPSLAAARKASQAEQALYQNRLNDLAVLASSAGVEEGFARIFRTLNSGLGESNDLVRGLAEGFNNVTKWADDLMLWPQSFVRALEGRDSLVADWLGYDTTRQLVADWKEVKTLITQISEIKAEDIFGDFLPNLRETSKELASIVGWIKEAKALKDGNLPTTKIEADQIERIDPFNTGNPYPSPVGLVKAFGNNVLNSIKERRERGQAIYDPESIYYNDPVGYDAQERDRKVVEKEESQTFLSRYLEEQKNTLLNNAINNSVLNNTTNTESYLPTSKDVPNPSDFKAPAYKEDLSRYAPQSKEEIDDFNNQQRLAAIDDANILKQVTNNNQVAINLNIDPITLAQMDIQAQAQELSQTIALNLEQVLVQFPNKE